MEVANPAFWLNPSRFVTSISQRARLNLLTFTFNRKVDVCKPLVHGDL